MRTKIRSKRIILGNDETSYGCREYVTYKGRDLTKNESSVVVERALIGIEGTQEIILNGEYLSVMLAFIDGEKRKIANSSFKSVI